MTGSRWTQCTPSEFAWERAALQYLQAHLPDQEPYRAWSNAEFLGSDGSVNEIDLLLIAPKHSGTSLAAAQSDPRLPRLLDRGGS